MTVGALRPVHALARLVPPEVRTPDFQALAELCGWLAHPMEFGALPDAVELFDGEVLGPGPEGNV